MSPSNGGPQQAASLRNAYGVPQVSVERDLWVTVAFDCEVPDASRRLAIAQKEKERKTKEMAKMEKKMAKKMGRR